MHPILRFAICVAGAALVAGPAAADVLPLKHGRYVTSGTPCAKASRATTVPFDGRGFDLGDNGCRYTSRPAGGNRFEVASDCSSVGEGKSIDVYEVLSATEFRINGEARTRRWCAPAELPSWTQAVKIR